MERLHIAGLQLITDKMIYFRFIPLIIAFAAHYSGNLYAQNSNNLISQAEVTAAIQTLKATKPFPDPRNGFGTTNISDFKQCLNIYNDQINAINTLGKARIPGTAPLLIPYLNYPTSEFRAIIMLGDSGGYTLKVWPAIEAFTEIPGSSKALADYALNKKNPTDYRFAAFQALSFVDRNQLKIIGSALSTEFSTSRKAQAVIQMTENDKRPFLYIGTDGLGDISK